MCVHFALGVIFNMYEYHEHLLDGKGRCCYGAEEALKGTKKFNAAAAAAAAFPFFFFFLHPPLSFWRRRPNFDLRTHVHRDTPNTCLRCSTGDLSDKFHEVSIHL